MEQNLSPDRPNVENEWRWIYCGIFCVIGIAIGLGTAYFLWKVDRLDRIPEIRDSSSGYRFINPLLDCDLGQEYLSNRISKPSSASLKKKIELLKKDGDLVSASLYYRDLNNGPWVGIGEKMTFAPASLLKLPIMMYYFKLAELDPSILQQKVVATPPSIQMEQHFKPSESLETGKEYSVIELIEHMIRYSDNQATLLLLGLSHESPIDKVLQDLAIEISKDKLGQPMVTVRDYAVLFRVLFNASYLNPVFSEKALQLLSESDFNHGMRGGIPSEILIAHKFGERELDADGLTQVHDCGIVYQFMKPYILCIMTRGNDPDRLAKVIADLSREVYQSLAK